MVQIPADVESLASMFDDKLLNVQALVGSKEGGKRLVAKHDVVEKTTDPVFTHTQPLTPPTFDMQYPLPLDPLEVFALCEEVSVLRNIPEQQTQLKVEFWMETTNLYMDAGQYVAFADGECPEEYTETGTYRTVTLKNLGVKKSLTLSDIKHSAAIAGRGGIGALLGGFPSGEREPGGFDVATFQRETVANIREKELVKGSTLLGNAWDWILVRGSLATDPLEFDGIETIVTAANGAHVNTGCPTGTFQVSDFDRFISEGCAKPTHLFGHPQALQEVAAGYFQLGFAGSQVVNIAGPVPRITPGYGFTNVINTQVGPLQLVGDWNFNRTAIAGDCGGLFRSIIYPLRMTHNGEPLIYRITQMPLAYKELTPGCTAISFQLWVKTALVIKVLCAQAAYTAQFVGNITSTCTRIGSPGPGRTGGAPTLP